MSADCSFPPISEDIKDRYYRCVRLYSERHFGYASKYFSEGEYEKCIHHLVEIHGAYVRYDGIFNCYPCRYTENKELNLNRDLLKFKDGCPDNECIGELYSKLAEMPSEWTLLQITREPHISDEFCPASKSQTVKNFFFCRLPCGPGLKKEHLRVRYFQWPSEWLINPLEAVLEFRNIFDQQGFSRSLRYQKRKKASENLEKYIEDLPSVFHEFVSWFPGRLFDSQLESAIRKRIDDVFMEYGNEDNAVRYEAYLLAEACMIGKGNIIFEGCQRLVTGSLGNALAEEIVKIQHDFGLLLSNAVRHPVIIITDEAFDEIPWECLPVLRDHPVSRVSSVHLLYALFCFHKPHIKYGLREIESEEAGYYIIDPDQNLPMEHLYTFFKKRLPDWNGMYQEKPNVETVISALSESNSYFFCGHGSGNSLLERSVNLQRLNIKTVQLLFGCNSSAHETKGGVVPRPCDAWRYLLAGSCCILGMLSRVLSGDSDRMTAFIVNKWFPGSQIDPENFEEVDGDQEPELLRILPLARKTCKMFGNGSALIARGLPVKLISSNRKCDSKTFLG